MNYRIEKDTLGEMRVEADKLWGAQTQRAMENFVIGKKKMPIEIIYGIATAKKAAACANCDLGVLPIDKRDLIVAACDEILTGQWDDQFPLHIWQTGSGTQTNMNVNEVIAHRGQQLHGGKLDDYPLYLSPNDDVNKSQSTNDIFPTGMRIAATKMLLMHTIPAILDIMKTYQEKIVEYADIRKIGRTHLMDATPLTLGQELSGHLSQIEHGLDTLLKSMEHLKELPIGGTAVGNGINAPEGYDKLALQYINTFTGLDFVNTPNKFEAMASHDSLAEVSGALKRLAISFMKIANDFRLLNSGPRCGIGEVVLPANEPGSSIMPGKVNPTQCEALSQVCCQVIGNDVAITTGAMQGHLQLNVFMPLIGRDLLQSSRLLADVIRSFNDHCLKGITPNRERIRMHLNNSLMLVTKLNPIIGYYNAAKIAQHALKEGLTLREAALELKLISEEDFDKVMKMD
ncbi:MAG: class II fumarate hydratase [Bacteroidales bacterium]|nr:class II fumarate hydratase [Bacteroidales bacterium]MBR6161970.1 class II fumarate hydratase [Bacteroidales bacterium]